MFKLSTMISLLFKFKTLFISTRHSVPSVAVMVIDHYFFVLDGLYGALWCFQYIFQIGQSDYFSSTQTTFVSVISAVLSVIMTSLLTLSMNLEALRHDNANLGYMQR
ncbi:hypothetical protein F4604DRAFT_1925690 [Suillus subluteus]|nr:hypothetical protein F4604DRAFT_1925690 [Suillus subluteus]